MPENSDKHTAYLQMKRQRCKQTLFCHWMCLISLFDLPLSCVWLLYERLERKQSDCTAGFENTLEKIDKRRKDG